MDHHELAQIWGPDTAHELTLTMKHARSSRSENIYLYCATGKRAKEKCIELSTLGVSAYYIHDFIDCD